VQICQNEFVTDDLEGAFTVRAKGSSIKLLYQGDVVCSANDDTYSKGKVALFNAIPAPFPSYKRVTIVAPD
jgi:hypothetical protein